MNIGDDGGVDRQNVYHTQCQSKYGHESIMKKSQGDATGFISMLGDVKKMSAAAFEKSNNVNENDSGES